MEADRLIDLGAGPGTVGSEADELLHVGVGRHDLARPREYWKVSLSAARGMVRDTDFNTLIAG